MVDAFQFCVRMCVYACVYVTCIYMSICISVCASIFCICVLFHAAAAIEKGNNSTVLELGGRLRAPPEKKMDG